jgi:hypothetical protein
MEEIERKTQRRKVARVEAAVSQTIEGIVFDFFKNYDGLSAMLDSMHSEDDLNRMYHRMFKEMEERIRCVDLLAKVSVFFPGVDKENPDLDFSKKPQSVTIYWGKSYQIKNNVPESVSIDVSQMLFV